jgi:opacity protein-like surface antigen
MLFNLTQNKEGIIMLRKGIAAAALIAASTSVFAGGPDVPPPAYIGGVYVDVGLSRDDVVDAYRQAFTFTETAPDQTGTTIVRGPNATYRADAGAPGWDGLIGFGYNYVWDNEWSFGFELFGDISSAHGTQFESKQVNLITGLTTNSSESLRVERTGGVSLLPGYFVAPGSLYFMELGYVNSEFDLRGFPNPYTNSPVINFRTVSGNPSREVDESGFRIGFGTNTQVGTHVAIRQEYIWETYGNVNARRDVTRTTDDVQGAIVTSNYTNGVRVSPDIGKYNLAAVYYFARQGNAPDLNTAPAHVGGHFYVGLNGSYDEAYSQASYWSERTTATTNGVVSADTTNANGGLMKITGWNVGLLAGYGMNFSNRWYLGAEVFGNWDDVDGRYNGNISDSTTTVNGVITTTATASNINSRLEKEWDFGAALIPGYQVSDNALLYARVGYVGAEFEINNRWVGATGYTAAQNALLTRNNERWLSGLQLGVGVDTVVYDNLSLRTEFNINNFGNYTVNTLVNTETVRNIVATTRISTIHRHNIEDQVNVALIWHFFG